MPVLAYRTEIVMKSNKDIIVQVTRDTFLLVFFKGLKKERAMINKKRLLIVTSNEADKAHLKTILEPNYSIVEASNGKEGFETRICV